MEHLSYIDDLLASEPTAEKDRSVTSDIGVEWKQRAIENRAGSSSNSSGSRDNATAAGHGSSRDEEVCELDGTSFSPYYGQLQHQQNMLQDWVRTGMYQYAFAQNASDFHGATVMDVGTGTGLLAFFAVQSGARKVYAVEMAKEMAACARLLVEGNHMNGVIDILECAVENTAVEEKMDIIVSEPIGFLLVHERMLESFVKARDMYLRPGGLMMPSKGVIMAAPFTDPVLWNEQSQKSKFWEDRAFYGIDLSPLKAKAHEEYMGQAVVGYFSNDVLVSQDRASHTVDFATVTLAELQRFEVPLRFTIAQTALCHGLGCWFDAHFLGTDSHVCLTTAPDQPGTHWYQCRLLLATPIAVNASQTLTGSLRFVASSKTSYTVTLRLELEGCGIVSENKINLADQMYHYLQGGAGAAAAGGYDSAGNWAGFAPTSTDGSGGGGAATTEPTEQQVPPPPPP